ncbi:TPA: hydroxymethylglutaryl-CoA reductase, degradative [archaeon]|uniref:3-hydroxy-3-methylglutaryl coenzyme A reductase n=1 Tax=Candidatus Naiadarchaeum limnaeum TaxID=2756139 RepID=A0A832XJB5_9ARCH|nr:hydroxymethylglutaryl-CoA reductase, degradative [Candidatus Naiadarchaeum limnaeum]
MVKSSQISGFYKLPIEKRLELVKEFANLSEEEVELLKKQSALDFSLADKMVENAIGTFPLPLGVAVNFLVNGKDYLVPMAIEEPSVIAAASNAAKIARVKGGFKSNCTDPIMIGQIQVVKLKNLQKARKQILSNKKKIIELCNKQDSTLIKFGGGCKNIEVRVLNKPEKMLVVHLLVDCRDAMGANAVNTMCEAVAPFIENLTGGHVYLRIISNLAVHRLVKAEAVFDKKSLGGELAVAGVIHAYNFAVADPFRAATHNKGIMNAVSSIAIATGNDFRALEAGAHAYASVKNKKYSPLTKFEKTKSGDLKGTLEMPMAVGLVGGATKVHPVAKVNIKILGVQTARELAEVIGAVGLAQNLAALRALATEGIQRGHMELHARNIAVTAGAPQNLAEKIAAQMIKEKNISVSRAKEILEQLK